MSRERVASLQCTELLNARYDPNHVTIALPREASSPMVVVRATPHSFSVPQAH
jgi:hypothetical protein